MAVYLGILFVLLVGQMSTLLLLSLPLPNILRKCIVKVYDEYLYRSSQLKTALVVLSCIVLSLFLDSYKRANVKLPTNENGLPPQPELLATKAYHQRNVYISGFILYYMLCIPFMVRLISKVAKLSGQSSTESEPKNATTTALQKELDTKIASMDALQRQYDNKKKFIDEKKFSELAGEKSDKKTK